MVFIDFSRRAAKKGWMKKWPTVYHRVPDQWRCAFGGQLTAVPPRRAVHYHARRRSQAPEAFGNSADRTRTQCSVLPRQFLYALAGIHFAAEEVAARIDCDRVHPA